MKYWKYLISAVTYLSLSTAYAKDNPELYRVSFNVENAGEKIGGWSNVVTATELKKGVDAPITNVVAPKEITTPTQKYVIGFNIKINVSKMNLANKGYANYLTVMSSYTTTQQISLSTDKIDKDESTLAQGKIVKTIFKPNNPNDIKEINTVSFSKFYDITTPRNIEVPFARFILTENNQPSLVTLKFKVEKVK